jgi:hypothetical protein
MGMEVSHEFDEKKKKTGYFGNNKLLGIEWASWKIALLFGKCCGSQPKLIDPDTPDANTQGQGRGSDLQSPGRNSSNVPTTSQPQTLGNSSHAQGNGKPAQGGNYSIHGAGSADITAQDNRIQAANTITQRQPKGSNTKDKQASKTTEPANAASSTSCP